MRRPRPASKKNAKEKIILERGARHVVAVTIGRWSRLHRRRFAGTDEYNRLVKRNQMFLNELTERRPIAFTGVAMRCLFDGRDGDRNAGLGLEPFTIGPDDDLKRLDASVLPEDVIWLRTAGRPGESLSPCSLVKRYGCQPHPFGSVGTSFAAHALLPSRVEG
jgi:hypothetical protein